MNKTFLLLLLLPLIASGCLIQAVNCEWVPPDAERDELITKMLWVTNLGTEVCDTTVMQLALAAWGLWLNWDDAESYTLPFICPGDTVLITMQEFRACNEEFYNEVDRMNPIFVDHYDIVEAPADSGLCDTFYIGNPTDGFINVYLTVDSVVGTSWDAYISPIAFTLAPGDSQAIQICSGYSGWIDSDTIGLDSVWYGGGGMLTFLSAIAEDSSRRPLDLSDVSLRQGRFRSLVNLLGFLPSIHDEYVSLTQSANITYAYNENYRNWIIRMENSYPFEFNVDLTDYWPGLNNSLEKVSFRASNPDNPYMVTYPSDANIFHSSITDASGISSGDAALNIVGSDEFYARQLLIQSTHDSYALKLQSPFHIEGLIIKDAGAGIEIYNDGVIEDFTFDDIDGSVVVLVGGSDVDLIASQVEPSEVEINGSGTISFFSRGRILVEDTLGTKLSDVAFTTYWGSGVSYTGLTNTYGGHSPFPVKWAEVKATLVDENKDVRFLLEHPDYITIDTIITVAGIQDWFKFTMEPPTGIDERMPVEFSVKVAPNPFNSSVAIYTPAGSNVEIFDLNGRLLNTWSNTPEDKIIWKPMEEISSGLYFLRVRYDNEEEIKRVMFLK